MSSHTQIWWKFGVCNWARFLCIGVWCGLDLTVATAMAVKSPHNPTLVSSNGHTGVKSCQNQHARNGISSQNQAFLKGTCVVKWPLSHSEIVFLKRRKISAVISKDIFFYSLQPFNYSNRSWPFLYVWHKLHSMEIQPEIGLLKLDFGWQLGSTVSCRFSPPFPTSNIFYLQACVHSCFVLPPTVSSLISACVLFISLFMCCPFV